MKTFESEFAKLADWIRQKTEEHIEKYKISENDNEKGYDGEMCYERTQERKLVVEEYNRRLDALKKKYGKEITPQETASRKETERVHV